MKFPDAPWGMKMACGENPKRVYGQKGGPSTRMGNVAGYRAAFIDAAEYIKKTEKDKKKDSDKPDSDKDTGGKRDLKLDTLAAAIQGDILVHIHRSEEHTSELQSLMRISYAVFCL